MWSGLRRFGNWCLLNSPRIHFRLSIQRRQQQLMTMNELQNAPLKRPLDKSNLGAEVAALNGLLGLMNNPAVTGAELPAGEPTKISGSVAPSARIMSEPVATPKAGHIRAIRGSKFAFTGRLKSGKDYVAAALDAKIVGFAEPLYFLQDYFFGTNSVVNPADKDVPGARQFLQTVGQWGWGALNAQYPLTPARACFVTMIRSLAASGAFPDALRVDWSAFGKSKTLWVDAAFARIEDYLAKHAAKRVAIVNARFEHEFKPLQNAGFAHYHVMCSQATWAKRLAQANLTPQSPAVTDLSEKLAHALDADVIKKISAQKSGPMLRAIWNDESAASPSPRLYTLSSFLQEIAIEQSTEERTTYAAE